MAIKFLNTIDGSQQFNIEDSNTILKKGGSHSLRVQTNSGYIDLGPKNTGWSHFETDRPSFYFNKTIYTGTGKISSYSSNDFIFQTNGTERLRIKYSNGNVGIGTTSPDSILDIRKASGTYNNAEPLLSMRGGNVGGNQVHKFEYTGDAGIYTLGYAGLTNDRLVLNGGSGNSGPSILFYDNANHTIQLAGSTTGVSFFNGGNVGIGITSPSKKLHVSVNDGDGIHLSHGGSDAFYIERSGSNNTVIKQLRAYTSVISISTIADAGTYDSSALNIVGQGVGAKSNVGIGTNTPSYKLDVAGDVRVGQNDGFYINNTNVGLERNANDLILGGYGGIRFRSSATTVGSQVERMIITSAGNVGIGTTSPNKKLDVHGEIALQNPSYYSGAYDWTFSQDSGNGRLSIGYYGSEKVSIKDDGNVGIGTTSPAAKLDVNGGINVTQNSYINWGGGSRIVGQSSYLRLQTSSQDRISITNTGNVGVGTTSPTQRLEVNGNILSSGSTYISASYDSNHFMRLEGNSSGGVLKGTDGGVITLLLRSYGQSYFNGGNVGIGTTSPSNKLDVVGNASVTALRLGSAASGEGIIRHYSGNGQGIGITTGDFNSSGIGLYVAHPNDNKNVGIGTTSPSYKLHVAGNTRVDNLTVAAQVNHEGDSDTYIKFDSNRIRLYAGGTVKFDTNDTIMQQSTADLRYLQLSGGTMTGAINTQSLVPSSDSSYNLGSSTNRYTTVWTRYLNSGSNTLEIRGGGTTIFKQSDVERMRLNSTGLGIGTTSPAAKLHVNGNGRFQGSLEVNHGVSTADAAINIGQSRTANGFAYLDLIGDTTYTDYGLRVIRNNSGANANSQINHRGTGDFELRTLEAGNITFDTSSNERMRIASSGNVGINTTSPTQKLDVNGSIKASSIVYTNELRANADSGSRIVIHDGAGNIEFRTQGGSERMTITYGGNVGIGTASPIAKLDVNGAARIGRKTTYTKGYGSLDTTGNAVAGLTSSSNGASAMFIFTCYGHTGSYQRIVYSCWNTSGTSWNVKKVIDEGDNKFDITVDAVGATRTFTFVSRSGTASYSPNVNIEHVGASLDTSYL